MTGVVVGANVVLVAELEVSVVTTGVSFELVETCLMFAEVRVCVIFTVLVVEVVEESLADVVTEV